MEPMPIEWREPIDLRPRYRLRRVAFFLGAATMGLYGLNALFHMLAYLGHSPFLWRMIQSPWWIWLAGPPVVFGRLIAAFLLLARGADASWRSRTTLLALLSTIDVGYWGLEHPSLLGLPFMPAPIVADGLGLVFGRAIGLVELMLFASLGSEITTELGWPEGEPLARLAKVTAGIGMSLWLIVGINQLDWRGGFPPRFLRFRDLETYLIFLASLGARGVSALFVTILCGNACALCSRMLGDLERQRVESDPFRSRSEASLHR